MGARPTGARGTSHLAIPSKGLMGRIIGRACAWLGALLAFLVLCGIAFQWVHSLTAGEIAFPGKLADVGGYRLHLLCEGTVGPTVLMEAGLPGSSLTWTSVTAKISEAARVCTYDRAGYAWSEASADPRTAKNIVADLRLLLEGAGIDPPYILVGHSFGGLVMQVLAGLYPNDIAGMVLVDSSHADLAHQSIRLERIQTISQLVGTLAPTGAPRLLIPLPRGDQASRKKSVRKLEGHLMTTTKSLRTAAAEMAALPESLGQAAAHRPELGQKPLIVLTEGRRRAGFWHDLQRDLAGLSSAGKWRVVEGAGHFIHHDRPDAVVRAVLDVLQRCQAKPDQDKAREEAA